MKFFNLLTISIFILFLSSNALKGQELSLYQYTFSTRYYIDGDNVTKSKFKKQLIFHEPSRKLYSHAITNRYFALGFNVAQIFTAYVGFQSAINYEDEKALNYLYATAGLGAICIYFIDLSKSYTRRAIYEYNHKHLPTPKFTFGTSAHNIIGIQYSLSSK